MLTHVKEKLQFVEKDNKDLEAIKAEVDDDVAGLRDRLTKLKLGRDRLRAENALLKQKQGFIGSDMLVGDFEGKTTHNTQYE